MFRPEHYAVFTILLQVRPPVTPVTSNVGPIPQVPSRRADEANRNSRISSRRHKNVPWGLAHLCITTAEAAPPFAIFEGVGSTVASILELPIHAPQRRLTAQSLHPPPQFRNRIHPQPFRPKTIARPAALC